jgi:hypothetical protein
MKKTRRVLERVRDDKFNWKPHEESMTIGTLAGHEAKIKPQRRSVILTSCKIDLSL